MRKWLKLYRVLVVLCFPLQPVGGGEQTSQVSGRSADAQQLASAAAYFRREVAALPDRPQRYRRGTRKSSNPTLSATRSGTQQRGIVIPAGGAGLLANAHVIIQVIRVYFGCLIPVEVAHCGPDELVSPFHAQISELADATLVDVCNPRGFPKHHIRPAEMHKYLPKIYALYHSKFDEVLMLDADSQPLVDPAQLFSIPDFHSHGSYFWPDIQAAGGESVPSKDVYLMFNLTEPWKASPQWRATESGQLLFNRAQHWDVLEWLLFINLHADLFVGQLWGDKDTFELAFHLAGKAHNFIQCPYPVRSALQAEVIQDDSCWHRAAIVQGSSSGRPFFLHRTMARFPEHYVADWNRIGYLTTPISPRLYMRFFYTKHDRSLNKSDSTMTLACSTLDASTAAILQQHLIPRDNECHWPDARDMAEITVIPASHWDETVFGAINPSYAAHERLQALIHSQVVSL